MVCLLETPISNYEKMDDWWWLWENHILWETPIYNHPWSRPMIEGLESTNIDQICHWVPDGLIWIQKWWMMDDQTWWTCYRCCRYLNPGAELTTCTPSFMNFSMINSSAGKALISANDQFIHMKQSNPHSLDWTGPAARKNIDMARCPFRYAVYPVD